MISKVVQSMSEDDKVTNIQTPNNIKGFLCRRAFEFCEKYINDPYSDITFPLDNQKMLPNYYNDFLDGLTSHSIISLLKLSDFLNIPQLLKLICFKLAYLMRDMSCKRRLDYFNINEPMLLQSA